MEFQVLGPGCVKCRKLAENAEAAAREMGVSSQVSKETDTSKIIAHGVKRTPALLIDGKLVVQGKVPRLRQ